MERGTEQNGEPGRQAGRDGRSDELMRTAREETNCHLTAIYSYRGGRCQTRLVFRLVRASRLSSRLLPTCLPSPGLSHCLIRFSAIVSFLVSCIRLVGRLVRFLFRRPSLLACIDTASPFSCSLMRSSAIVSRFAPPLPPSLLAPYHDSG